jgi:pimeloyl-ACP methyl ester carboxylesterase
MILAHDVEGDGPTVLLLHSSVCDRRMWEPQWQMLIETGYRLVRADFRGHGETPAPTEPYNAADDVRDMLDELGIDTIAIIGSSYGGRIAQEFAARWPERVTALGLVCAATRLHPPTEAIKAFSDREDELLEAGDVEGAVELNVATFLGPAASPEVREQVAAMQRHAFEVQLAVQDYPAPRNSDYDLTDITAPTLVISGSHDVDYFQSTAQMLARTIPDAEHLVLPWAGHLPSLEDPERLNPLILRALQRARG